MPNCCWESSASGGACLGEWYASFSTLQPLLQRQLQFTDNLLVFTQPQAPSVFHEDLYDSGYRDITAVHSHSEVVQDMRQKQAAANRATLQCQVADIAEGLAFDHSPYAAIIDKGALDAVLCRPTGLQEAEAAMLHVWSNLKASGTFILFTHGPLSLRMPLLERLQWSVRMDVVDATADAEFGDASTFVYVCKKPYL